MAAHGKEWKNLGDGSLPSEEPSKGLGHIVSVPVYNAVFASLISLTVITVWAATVDFGVLSLTVAFAIATVKAAIVTLYFMHLNWENKLTWFVVIYPLIILALLILGTLGDASVRMEPDPLSQKQIQEERV